MQRCGSSLGQLRVHCDVQGFVFETEEEVFSVLKVNPCEDPGDSHLPAGSTFFIEMTHISSRYSHKQDVGNQLAHICFE